MFPLAARSSIERQFDDSPEVIRPIVSGRDEPRSRTSHWAERMESAAGELRLRRSGCGAAFVAHVQSHVVTLWLGAVDPDIPASPNLVFVDEPDEPLVRDGSVVRRRCAAPKVQSALRVHDVVRPRRFAPWLRTRIAAASRSSRSTRRAATRPEATSSRRACQAVTAAFSRPPTTTPIKPIKPKTAGSIEAILE